MIKIDNEKDGYRAVVSVRPDLGVDTGRLTKEGPWVDGYGFTPSSSIEDLYRNVGKAYVLTLGKPGLLPIGKQEAATGSCELVSCQAIWEREEFLIHIG